MFGFQGICLRRTFPERAVAIERSMEKWATCDSKRPESREETPKKGSDSQRLPHCEYMTAPHKFKG